MKSEDCNQIKIFINLEIIGEEDKYKKIIVFVRILGSGAHCPCTYWA